MNLRLFCASARRPVWHFTFMLVSVDNRAAENRVATKIGWVVVPQSWESRYVTKLMGTIRITPNTGSETAKPHFEVCFVPYHGRFNTPTLKFSTHDELVQFLMDIKISEDEAARWAGKARSQGVVLISGVERTEAQFRESGLIA
jgi:hypothetical protein